MLIFYLSYLPLKENALTQSKLKFSDSLDPVDDYIMTKSLTGLYGYECTCREFKGCGIINTNFTVINHDIVWTKFWISLKLRELFVE